MLGVFNIPYLVSSSAVTALMSTVLNLPFIVPSRYTNDHFPYAEEPHFRIDKHCACAMFYGNLRVIPARVIKKAKCLWEMCGEGDQS